MTRRGQAGRSALGSLLGLLFGGGAVLVVAALFMTGLAQREILPRVRARAERAMERATSAVKPGSKAPAGDATGANVGSAGAGMNGLAVGAADTAGAPRDSVQALSAQMETQKSFLAQREVDLKRIRAGIDSLQHKADVVDGAELKRQAKLFAAMKAEEAALVLGAMDDATVALLLDAMNAKAAAKVMARLDAGRVARLASRAVHKGEMTGAVTLAGQEAGPAAR
jgi:flagellar motility protein MotE (MotC chaperone)